MMLDLSEKFLEIIKLDEKLNEMNEDYIESIKNRDDSFKEIVHYLNNHRDELREEYGIVNYNYSDVCKVEEGDDLRDRDYCFKVVFNRIPSAHDLSVIEQITSCEFRGQKRNSLQVFYFKLPKIIHYNLPYERR